MKQWVKTKLKPQQDIAKYAKHSSKFDVYYLIIQLFNKLWTSSIFLFFRPNHLSVLPDSKKLKLNNVPEFSMNLFMVGVRMLHMAQCTQTENAKVRLEWGI